MPFPSPEDLPDPGIEPGSPVLQADSLLFELQGRPSKGIAAAAAGAKSLQSYPTLCDPIDCSTPGLPVHHQLPAPAQTHVHRVSDAIQPSRVCDFQTKVF